MKFIKKQLAVLLAILTIASTLIFCIPQTATAAYDTSKLVELKEKFPAGKYWNHVGSSKNNPNGYTSTPCTHHGSACNYSGTCGCNSYNNAIQCMGYAHKIVHDITGVDVGSGWEKIYTLKASDLCVGDEIRYLHNGHSIAVLGVDGNTIAYTGANWGANCLIRWGTMNINEITGFSYVYHLKGNTRKNSDFSFLEGKSNSEYWMTKKNDDSILRIRNSPSLSNSEIIGQIPPQTKFIVLDSKYWDGEHLWAKIRYDGKEGYAAIEYATYVSGGKDKVDAKNVSDVFAGTEYKFSWNSVGGANIYYVTLYDKNKDKIKTYETTKTSQNVVFPDSGTSYINVSASNTKATTWSIHSGKIEISVLPAKALYLDSIKLPKSVTLGVGSSTVLDADFEPQTASKDIKWKSSDNSVATVSTSGKVSGLKYGTATITAYSDHDNSIKATCKITVATAKVSGTKQTGGNSSGTSVTVQWNAVKGATGYRVYLKSGDSYKKITDTTKTTATVSKLTAGNSYSIMIRSYRKSGDDTIFGEVGSNFTVKTARKAPTGLKCTSQTTSGYKISWKAVSGASKYSVYRYSASNKKWTMIATQTSTSLSLKGETGNAFKYAVSAWVSNDDASIEGAKSSGVYGYRAGNTKGKAAGTKTEVWKTKKDNAARVNIRKSPDLDASVITGIEPNKTFNVYSKKWDGTYLWAKVKYGETTGWAVLNYATYQSGGKDSINLKSSTGIFPKTDYKLSWTGVTGANKYTVQVFNSSDKKISSQSVTKASATIKLPSAGKYYVRIVATNKVATSWKVDSGKIQVYALAKK